MFDLNQPGPLPGDMFSSDSTLKVFTGCSGFQPISLDAAIIRLCNAVQSRRWVLKEYNDAIQNARKILEGQGVILPDSMFE